MRNTETPQAGMRAFDCKFSLNFFWEGSREWPQKCEAAPSFANWAATCSSVLSTCPTSSEATQEGEQRARCQDLGGRSRAKGETKVYVPLSSLIEDFRRGLPRVLVNSHQYDWGQTRAVVPTARASARAPVVLHRAPLEPSGRRRESISDTNCSTSTSSTS